MSHITFEYPIAFLLLILFFICLKFCKERGVALYFPNIGLLEKASKKSILSINILKFLTILFMVIALSSPIKEDTLVVKSDKGYEISLILDASGSMRDYNKFGIVKNIVADFINKRKHDKLALSIFADFAYVAVPLTYDKESIKRLLDKLEVGIAGQRTALFEALFLNANLFKGSKSKNKIAILLTDGINNVDTIPLDVAIKRARKYGIKVYTIGIGRAGFDFDSGILKKIAKETGGKYFHANTVQGIKDVYATIDKLEKSEIKANKYVKKSYYFQYFLAFAILFFILYFYMINRE